MFYIAVPAEVVVFQLPIGLPPLLPDLKEELEEKFLKCPEKLPVHDLDRVQK